MQICGASLGWDHVFVALGLVGKQQQLIYWCSDNVLKLLRALQHQSPYASDVAHVTLQDRHITLMLTRSNKLLSLKETEDNWEFSVIKEGVTNVSSCNVNINDNDMTCVIIQSGLLMFLTVDHMIHASLLPTVTVCEVSCGVSHLLLLDTTGHVYSCGHGNRGQLGHGDTTKRNCPTIIELTAVALRITKISAGGWHSAMLSGCHDIYTNGWNCDGQLGHSLNIAIVTRPTLVSTDDSVQFNLIACGSRHTVAVSNHNDIYGWGWNKYKQLEQLDCVIQDVKCGLWNTLFLTI